MAERIIRLPEMEKNTGLTNVTLWRWEKEGRFPKRIKLGQNTMGWLESEYNDWVQQRAAERL